MSPQGKRALLERVTALPGSRRQALAEVGLPKSTYYRWRQSGQARNEGALLLPWNHLTRDEEHLVLAAAREAPERPSRQLAAWITDHQGFSVSESTVYRILRREGLVKRRELPMPAGNEYHRKTSGAHQLWATDASYFKVVGWGYYYLVTVMDDFSRFILAWKLQRDMTANSLIEVVQQAVDFTGMTDVPVEDRTKLLSDNGSGYISRAFGDYLRLVGIRHILAAPFHPQTNGKLERYHRTLKHTVNQVPHDQPSHLNQALADFVAYYNFQRYHKALGDITPADVLHGNRDHILKHREEVQARTLERRKRYNQSLRKLPTLP